MPFGTVGQEKLSNALKETNSLLRFQCPSELSGKRSLVTGGVERSLGWARHTATRRKVDRLGGVSHLMWTWSRRLPLTARLAHEAGAPRGRAPRVSGVFKGIRSADQGRCACTRAGESGAVAVRLFRRRAGRGR